MSRSDDDDADPDRDRKELRARRKALTLETVEEAIRRNNNNVAQAERELDVGGTISGNFLHGWLRRQRQRPSSPPSTDDQD